MQPILSPSKVSVHLSSWDISRDFHFHSNLLIYIAANNWQDYIKSFSIHGWRKILFSWPKRDIIFLLSSWDIAILFDRLHRFELGAIRFPRIFFNSNTWYWDENKAKLTNFIELAILEFWCPKRTHNTKSTLLPLKMIRKLVYSRTNEEFNNKWQTMKRNQTFLKYEKYAQLINE